MTKHSDLITMNMSQYCTRDERKYVEMKCNTKDVTSLNKPDYYYATYQLDFLSGGVGCKGF